MPSFNGWNTGSLYYSRHTSFTTSANQANTTLIAMWDKAPLPCFGVRFDATKWHVDIVLDPLVYSVYQADVMSENLATCLGTNYTHVGFGTNSGGSLPGCWFRHLKQVHA
jgi:hypothetical protein